MNRCTHGYGDYHDCGICCEGMVRVLEFRVKEMEAEANEQLDRGVLVERIEELEATNDRLRQDRSDALNVKSKDGLLSSEWVARTGEAERERDTAEAQLELKDIQLAACMTVAGANTRETAKKVRDMHPDYRCAAVEDVERAVDREMAHREQLEQIQEACREVSDDWAPEHPPYEAQALIERINDIQENKDDD